LIRSYKGAEGDGQRHWGGGEAQLFSSSIPLELLPPGQGDSSVALMQAGPGGRPGGVGLPHGPICGGRAKRKRSGHWRAHTEVRASRLSLADIRPNRHPQSGGRWPDPWFHGREPRWLRSATFPVGGDA